MALLFVPTAYVFSQEQKPLSWYNWSKDFIRGNQKRAYYHVPATVAALAPYLYMAYLANGGQPNKAADALATLGLFTSPALFGASEIAYRYFNPPAQEPSVPVLPEQQSEEQKEQVMGD